ncbi:DUF6597 domain-containing transcriptional factor [Hymenobacter terrenus]|uniref:DUF6597 domain-containing transcriptional factor n=1 Tax=Hymenobacter terrenus TaxID=1629124 RepID=UPI0006192D92|nr:AraC family transcriptional regulator [Hymenobacter terrenus]
MHFQQIAPPDFLREYVRYFWTLENRDGDVVSRTFRTIADGCPGLLFQQVGHALFYDQTHEPWPRLLLYGQATRSGEAYAQGSFRILGVCFYSTALTSVFGLDADELTDSCVDPDLLSTTQAAHLSEQLSNTPALSDQIELLSAYLLAKVRKNQVLVGDGIRHCLTQLMDSGGRASLQNLQQRLGISERSFQRKFKQCVGLSPKLFARICQFQASLQQLRNQRYDKLSDVALENDYADQSHHIRTFKEFAGFSPYQYQKYANGLVDNFTELVR